MVLERKIRVIGGRPVWRAEVDGRVQARLISYGDSDEEGKVRRTFSFLAAWRSSMAWIMVGSSTRAMNSLTLLTASRYSVN